MKFSNIPVERNQIEQGELNIENKIRSNLFSWNGQFSPQLIETLLRHYATPSTYVFDPFLGSGTILYECARRGIQASGVELNVSAYYMSKLYEFANVACDERQEIVRQIDCLLSSAYQDAAPCLSLLSVIAREHERVSDTLSLLIILVDLYHYPVSVERLRAVWERLKTTLLSLPYSASPIQARRGDARQTFLADRTADLLITSPPYINVLNYHQKYRRSVEFLGYDVLAIAKSELGSNRKNRGNRLLTVIQYCMDMSLAMRESSRVCKQSAHFIYVVGRESTVLGFPFCNSELIYKIGTDVLGFDFLFRQERVFKNRYGRMIYEDILHFSNTARSETMSRTRILQDSKQVAKNALLEEATRFPGHKNMEFLHNALASMEKVKESEVSTCEAYTEKKFWRR